MMNTYLIRNHSHFYISSKYILRLLPEMMTVCEKLNHLVVLFRIVFQSTLNCDVEILTDFFQIT